VCHALSHRVSSHDLPVSCVHRMAEDKQVQPAIAATATLAFRRRVRVASAPETESIELSSLPPSKDKTRGTSTNSLAAPAPAHFADSNTNQHDHDNAHEADQDHDHHRTHLPAVPTKNSSELSSLQRFWARHVSLAVEHEACRDHLGQSFRFSHPFPSKNGVLKAIR